MLERNHRAQHQCPSQWFQKQPDLFVSKVNNLPGLDNYPLLALEDKDAVPLKLRPLAFDGPSEWEFVRDLEAFCHSPDGKQAIGQRSLYLLRNADRKEKGLGFALAGNFYPDFLLWLVDDVSGKQWLTFVDPKGLRNLDLSHPKLGLYQEVKTLEQTLAAQAKPGELAPAGSSRRDNHCCLVGYLSLPCQWSTPLSSPGNGHGQDPVPRALAP